MRTTAAAVSSSPETLELRHERISQRRDFERIGHGVDRSGTVTQARRSGARRKRAVVGVAILVAGLVAGCGGSSSPQDAWDAQLTESITTAMREASIPGAIVGVWQDGKAPYVQAFGVRDTASGEPMATDLHMRIGSLTKTFTVTAVLQLVDQGKIGLDDPIDRYVPGVPGGNMITIRQLAAMRSGLYSYTDDLIPTLPSNPGRQWTPQELLTMSFNHPPRFAPGTEFDYSNTNTVLLGLVIEKVSGQSIEAYLDANILGPERMAHTVFPTDAAFPSPHAQGYMTMPDGEIVNTTDWNPSWGWAAGAMISTLDDLRTWIPDLATGTLLSPATQREREQFLPAPQEGEGAEYGLGLENQNGWIGHNGNIVGYLTYPYYLPSEKITMIVLLNSSNVLGSWALIQAMTKIISPDHPWPNLPTEP